MKNIIKNIIENITGVSALRREQRSWIEGVLSSANAYNSSLVTTQAKQLLIQEQLNEITAALSELRERNIQDEVETALEHRTIKTQIAELVDDAVQNADIDTVISDAVNDYDLTERLEQEIELIDIEKGVRDALDGSDIRDRVDNAADEFLAKNETLDELTTRILERSQFKRSLIQVELSEAQRVADALSAALR